jgi:hypothetical protein
MKLCRKQAFAALLIATSVLVGCAMLPRAVDIDGHSPRAQGRGALAIAGFALQGQNCRLAAPEYAEADVLIAPVVRVASLTDRDEQEADIGCAGRPVDILVWGTASVGSSRPEPAGHARLQWASPAGRLSGTRPHGHTSRA